MSINPSVTQRVQVHCNADHMWVPYPTTVTAFSYFQVTSASGSVTDHDRAVRVMVRNLKGVGLSSDGLTRMKLLGGVSASNQWAWQGTNNRDVQSFTYSHPDYGRTQVAGGMLTDRLEVGSAQASPSITSGTGAPSAAEPNGSVYLRTDGTAATTIYRRAAGAWSAVG